MHIVVLGAGALGAYFGLRFQEAGAKVTFLVREKRANQLERYGLAIQSPHGNICTKEINWETDPSAIPSADVILVSVKGYHLSGALDQLRPLVNKGATILPVLNGIEHISILQREFGKDHVLGGLAFIIATLNDKGHVVHTGKFHDLIFGPLCAKQEKVIANLEALREKAVMGGKQTKHILYELWKKYMFINAFSGITTATNLPIGAVRKHEETFQIAIKLLAEMKHVAMTYGVEITDQDVTEAIKKMEQFDADATSSMHQDLRKGLPLELDHLHGGAIRLAKAKQLDLACMSVIYGMIKPFENRE
ncbi:2-dehydropantoate 2-reductase [Virgibacillus dokdonensis]|uniref:2-dehydropantoate 2-reductase n=1 Tax=Virgibacillus dokdonensis TaxID=302167 RepID=A0A3E0WSV6_9BACI|nr:2-dehydropantoate 2-reductase [Virgibacillus dokdonensis]RFA35047.1 2-dehydropantoate 2-reductase [Virgibacillus dokdonensis]